MVAPFGVFVLYGTRLHDSRRDGYRNKNAGIAVFQKNVWRGDGYATPAAESREGVASKPPRSLFYLSDVGATLETKSCC